MKQINVTAGIDFLTDAGLNLFAVLDCATLPEAITTPMLASGVPLSDYRRLLLLGHGGRRLWTALQKWGWQTADPIDHYSTQITRQFIRHYLGDPPTCWLYPNAPYLVPLQQLGTWAGWSYPSPLGQGIHPEFGVWFAYRAAFLTTVELPLCVEPERPSPCASCLAKPCIATCPVEAVQMDRFDVDGCAHYRLRTQSPCVDRCLARLACPVFPEHRYTLAQIQYHYHHSLATLRDWYDQAV
jgi:epoxyqueuosine reductase